jgi:hypothetical protein
MLITGRKEKNAGNGIKEEAAAHYVHIR